MIKFALLALALCSTCSWGASLKGGVYRGDLAGQPVVMSIQPKANSGTYAGTYFYERYGNDIGIEGTPDHLSEFPLRKDGSKGKSTGVWSGAASGDAFAGQWRNPAGKTLSFHLQRVNEPAGVAGVPATSGDDLYSQLRDATGPRKVSQPVNKRGVGYVTVTDVRTGVSSPHLVHLADQGVMQKVNQVLDGAFMSHVHEQNDCNANAYSSDINRESSASASVTYLSPTLLSVEWTGEVDCGGAHPQFVYEIQTFDLLTGAPLDFNKLFDALTYTPVSGDINSSDPAVLAEQMRALRAGSSSGIWGPSPAMWAFIERNANRYRLKNEGQSDDDSEQACTALLQKSFGLIFEEPGRLAFAVTDAPHADGYCLGVQRSVPFSALTPLEKPAARQYLGL